LDSSTRPKAISFSVGQDRHWLGIYDLEENRLRIAYRQDGPRPTEFLSEPGSNVTLLELERPGPDTATREDAASPPDPAAELKRLQGAWEVVSVEAGEASDLAVARPYPEGFDLSNARHMHIQDHLVFYDVHRGATAHFAYKVDPTSRTKTIDLFWLPDDDKLFAQGIYELQDEQLRVCLTRKLSAVIASQRPHDFTIEPGSSDVLFVFRRRQPSRDEKAIDGWWNVVSATHHGRQLPEEELADKTAVFFDPYSFQIDFLIDEPRKPDATGGQDMPEVAGLFQLDPSTRPKAITFSQWPTKHLFGVYELEEDRLRIAYREEGPRPTEFTSEPGSNVTLLELERLRPGTAAGAADEDAAPSDPAAEVKGLRGLWKVESVEVGEAFELDKSGYGLPLPADTHHWEIYDVCAQLLAFEAREYHVWDYALDLTQSPSSIDLSRSPVAETPHVLGIYELEGDRLKICLTQVLPTLGAGQRPRDFAIGPGSGNVLYTLRRHRPSDDEEALQGMWRAVAVTENGRQSSEMTSWTLTFLNYFGVWMRVGAGLVLEGVYSLDPGRQPKTINLTSSREKLKAIYELEGDRLRVAYRKGGARPTELLSEPGSGVTLLELVRQKEKTAQGAAGAKVMPGPPQATD
ncbi:MAG: TIGR03067 domain-containing protein, partial [Planctomycetota bacterium]